jgi:hypothetical protein
VVSFMVQLLYFWGKCTWCLLTMMLRGPQNWLKHYGKKRKILVTVRNWILVVQLRANHYNDLVTPAYKMNHQENIAKQWNTKA